MSQTLSEFDQLERILNSTQLAASPSLSRFLRYIVEETLAGRQHDIREYTLGVHVFDRGTDFNPRLDPIVRVQARNLRSRMSRYYEGPGADDPIRIDLPKGSYVPIFHKRVVELENPEAPTQEAPEPAPFTHSVMPAPPPRSPVADRRGSRYWIAAVILLAILIGMAAIYLLQSHGASQISLARALPRFDAAWVILGG